MRSLTENDFEDCWQILGSDFTKIEPICYHHKLPVDCSEAISLRSWNIKQGLKQNVSIGAYEKISNKIVGCIILHLSHKAFQTGSPPNIDEAPLCYRQIRKLLSFSLEGVTQIEAVGEYMKVLFIATHKNYMNCGIASSLLKHAMNLAQQESCKLMCIRSGNYYVQRMVTKYGFECCNEVFYSDYIDPFTQEKVFQGIPEPHKKIAVYIKYL